MASKQIYHILCDNLIKDTVYLGIQNGCICYEERIFAIHYFASNFSLNLHVIFVDI